jgi:MinD-like ATPase involved in chromosome partitioning or flagellar assembly
LARIISVHSFRGGTGKSNVTANLAVLAAEAGHRVGVVDTDIQSPGIHVLFGLGEEAVDKALNDYLWGRCDIEAAAYPIDLPGDGALFVIPSSLKLGEITRILREGYSVDALTDSFREVVRGLELDVLFIDTHPGLNEETLVSVSISDVLVLIMRPDRQDYLGTGVTADVTRRLGVPQLFLLMNKIPEPFDAAALSAQLTNTYGADVLGLLPQSDAMMRLSSEAVYALRFPDDPLTESLRDMWRTLEKSAGA